MTLRWIAVPTALSLALISPAAPTAGAAQSTRPDPAGFIIPLQVSVSGPGSFSGALRLLAFRVENDQLVAIGLLSGSRVDEAGTASSIVRTVKLPASTAAPPPVAPPAPSPSPEPPLAPELEPPGGAEAPSAPPAAAAPPVPATCQALRVELGPLEADVLGTAIRVDRVLLEVDPVTRGAVAVLCGPAGTPGADAPRDLARKLNRLIVALT